MHPVIHFEMPYEDRARLSAFYQQAFGWQMQTMGEEMGHYVLATTPPTENGMPTTPGAINGGFFARSESEPAQPSVVIATEDLAQTMAMVRQAGGEVLCEPMPIPGVGSYVVIRDSEGNRVGVLQPNSHGA